MARSIYDGQRSPEPGLTRLESSEGPVASEDAPSTMGLNADLSRDNATTLTRARANAVGNQKPGFSVQADKGDAEGVGFGAGARGPVGENPGFVGGRGAVVRTIAWETRCEGPVAFENAPSTIRDRGDGSWESETGFSVQADKGDAEGIGFRACAGGPAGETPGFVGGPGLCT